MGRVHRAPGETEHSPPVACRAHCLSFGVVFLSELGWSGYVRMSHPTLLAGDWGVSRSSSRNA